MVPIGIWKGSGIDNSLTPFLEKVKCRCPFPYNLKVNLYVLKSVQCVSNHVYFFSKMDKGPPSYFSFDNPEDAYAILLSLTTLKMQYYYL